MTISAKHLFQSAKSDGADATVVQPGDWNDEHVLTMATARLLGRTTASAGAVEELSVGNELTLASGGLSFTRAITVSTSDPSGGSDGDLWFKVA